MFFRYDEGEDPPEARRICATCPPPAARRCMILGWTEEYGIWCGTTPEERLAARQAGLTPERLHAITIRTHHHETRSGA